MPLQYFLQSKVLVSLEPREQEVQVHVKDSGQGIAEEHISYIFDQFYRADKDRSREHGGMGLGLAIAKEYVKAHQGGVTVKSKVGERTVFTVHLRYND